RRCLKVFGTAFAVIPTHAITTLPGNKFVVNPLSLREALAEMADRTTIQPERHFTVGIANVVDLHHDLDANPPPALHLQPGIADKRVAPRLAAGRTAPHLAPIGVVIPGPV